MVNPISLLPYVRPQSPEPRNHHRRERSSFFSPAKAAIEAKDPGSSQHADHENFCKTRDADDINNDSAEHDQSAAQDGGDDDDSERVEQGVNDDNNDNDNNKMMMILVYCLVCRLMWMTDSNAIEVKNH